MLKIFWDAAKAEKIINKTSFDPKPNDPNPPKSKGSDVTFIKQVPLHPREKLKRLSKVDDKLYFVREVASVKPKHTSKTKRKN